MQPTSRTYGSNGAKDPFPLDYNPTSQITAAVTFVTTGSVNVQVTLDNVLDQAADDYVAPASARWFAVKGFAASPVVASEYVTFDGPWRAIRVNVVDFGTGVVFQLGQSTTPRA